MNRNQDWKAGLNCKPSSVLTSSNKLSSAAVCPVASSAIGCPSAPVESSKSLQIEETSYLSEAPQELGYIVVEAESQEISRNFSENICSRLQSNMKESSFSDDDDSELDDEYDEDWNEDDHNTCNYEVYAILWTIAKNVIQ